MKTDDQEEPKTGANTFRVSGPLNLEKLRQQVVIEPYRSSGPGGQRKNRKKTAIRLTHVPTGTVVIASERRSQAANRQVAFERLRKRLKALSRTRKRRLATRPPASAIHAQHEQKRRISERKKQRRKPEHSVESE